MDILALPDTFLKKLMSFMKIKDRLSLRLICREFENLVSESHAGHCCNGSISVKDVENESTMSIQIGDYMFREGEYTEEGVDLILKLRNRLFKGIAIADLDVELTDQQNSLDFFREFTKNFEIGVTNFKIWIDIQLEHALQHMNDFPQSKYSMKIYYYPIPERLLALPSMEYLEIMPKSVVTSFIPNPIFFKLLTTQDDLFFDYECVSFTSNDWKKAMQVMSRSGGTRMVEFYLKCTNIVDCMRDYGITNMSKDGDWNDEFEILSCDGPSNDVTVHFRFERCYTRILGISWAGGDALCSVTMETNEEW
ncbi:hypothetical protein PRIPAC_85861 [Pristionchus pacificus]|nr:hypothetical protein PRIPAC_85861 [Pristionchus pacificus]